MIVKIPRNNINERKFIIDVMLKEFLGLNYTVEIKDINHYEIILNNKSKLIIEDYFFNKFQKVLRYLNEKNIPQSIKFSSTTFIVEKNIPIIYGNDKFNIKKDEIICGIDIFASSFFMLTRWEEHVNKTRDLHNRFPAYASLAYKNNFLDRPIVNEYIEMLWNMLKKLGINQERKKREFKFVLTHDVDYAHKYRNSWTMFRELTGDIFLRKDLILLKTNILNQFKNKLGLSRDPYDTFDYLMDISDKIGAKSYFFLHSSNSSKQDINNDRFLKKIARKIVDRGHYLGYHPSYNAYNDLELFIRDKEKIEKIIEQKLKFGRQHFLRFEIPSTWQIWEDANMEWDSTLGYADKEGFRCGVCYPFSTFNLLTRKKLNLQEKPLIVMDGSFIAYQKNITPVKMQDKINYLIQKVKRYNGEFVFLWHNSSFGSSWKRFEYIYEEVLLNNS